MTTPTNHHCAIHTHPNATSDKKTGRHIAATASILLAFGVLLGAFGAHGLKNIANTDAQAWWQTATLYLFIHALGLFALALLVHLRWCRPWISCLFLAGILLFSGSLYAMALGLPRWLGMVTPIGGLLFVAGWCILTWQLIRRS